MHFSFFYTDVTIVIIISFSIGVVLLVLGCGFMCVAKARSAAQQVPRANNGELTGKRIEYRHIWETPLPQPSAPTLSSNHDAESYMNDPRPAMIGSVGHGSDLSYCTQGQSQQRGRCNTPMYHVLDREAVLREMASHFQNTLPAKRGCPTATDATGNTL